MRQKIRKTLLFISFICLPITLCYFSPVLIILDTAKGIISGSFVVFSVIFVLSVFFGRLFCGWLCPCGGGQECVSFIGLKRAKGGWQNYIKYFVSALWIGTIISFAIQAGGYTALDFFRHTDSGISLITQKGAMAYPMYYIVMSMILIPTLLFGRRAFCHYVCWLAPLIILGTKIQKHCNIPGVRLKAQKNHCIGCKKCDTACPMSLNVYDMVQQDHMNNNECILCNACTDACPQKAIKIGLWIR